MIASCDNPPFDPHLLIAVPTGKIWHDGRVIFRKVINTGALPNAGVSSEPHGITNLDTVVSARGYAHDSGNGYWINIPQ